LSSSDSWRSPSGAPKLRANGGPPAPASAKRSGGIEVNWGRPFHTHKCKSFQPFGLIKRGAKMALGRLRPGRQSWVPTVVIVTVGNQDRRDRGRNAGQIG
jgi:hypothetical protein